MANLMSQEDEPELGTAPGTGQPIRQEDVHGAYSAHWPGLSQTLA
jgi:hypothetical protein